MKVTRALIYQNGWGVLYRINGEQVSFLRGDLKTLIAILKKVED